MRAAATTAASGRRSVDLLIGLIGGGEPPPGDDRADAHRTRTPRLPRARPLTGFRNPVIYPHPESAFPGLLHEVKAFVEDPTVSEDDARRVLYGNAAEVATAQCCLKSWTGASRFRTPTAGSLGPRLR